MDDSERAELLEEAFELIECELLFSKREQQDQLRLVRRQKVIVKRFKETGCCDEIGFSDFLRQSIFLIFRMIIELFGNHRS